MTRKQSKRFVGEQQRLLTVHEAAVQVRQSDRTVHRWKDAGDLPHHRFGRSIRIAQEDLDAFIAKRRRRGKG